MGCLVFLLVPDEAMRSVLSKTANIYGLSFKLIVFLFLYSGLTVRDVLYKWSLYKDNLMTVQQPYPKVLDILPVAEWLTAHNQARGLGFFHWRPTPPPPQIHRVCPNSSIACEARG
jgi:hypothetical protein